MDQEPTDPKDLPTANSSAAPVPPAPATSVPTPPAQPATPTQGASGAGHIDIDKVLLPQKEVRKVESAQRVNAGILLEQEQTAGREGAPKSPENPPTSADSSLEKPKEEVSSVKSIETYQSDIEQLVQDKNVSVLTIAAAEAERRSKTGSAAQTTEGGGEKLSFAQKITEFIKNIAGRTAMIFIGIILLVAATGAVAYIFLRPTTTPPPQAILSPFIVVDDTKAIAISAGDTRGTIMTNLVNARDTTNLALGLIDRLVPVVASTTASGQTTQTAMDVQSFLSAVAPNIPADLLRNVEPTYLLGVHVYNSNQPFMILKIDSYEAGYAGMLAWEPDMLRDLSPLFAYTPRPRIPEENAGTSTVSTSGQLIQSGFVDRIVENHDARVLQNQSGDIYLLWTFLDRNTLVITTNEGTLREVISRLQNAPVTPIPGQ
jgi:hypothetical protein